jgi:hypothetical protein
MIQFFSMQDWCCGLVSKERLLERMQSVYVCVVPCPQQPVDSLNCGMYCAKNAKFIHENLPTLSERLKSQLQSKGFLQLHYNDEDVSSDRIQLSIRIRQLSKEYKEWLTMNPVSLQRELEVNKTNPASIGLGGQKRTKITKECNEIPFKIVDLCSEDEAGQSLREGEKKTREFCYVKENLDSTFIPSICPSLVDQSVKEYYNNEKKIRNQDM